MHCISFKYCIGGCDSGGRALVLTRVNAAVPMSVQVLEALAATHPKVTAAEVNKVKERFRAQYLCDRVLAACAAAQEASA